MRWSPHTSVKYVTRGCEMSFSDTTALVTGASGDIGREIACDLLRAGAEVFMLGRNVVKLCRPQPRESAREKCRYVVADLTDNIAVGRVAHELSPKGRLDILVLRSALQMQCQLALGSHKNSVVAPRAALCDNRTTSFVLLKRPCKKTGQGVFDGKTPGVCLSMTGKTERVEVITSVQRRRSVVQETYAAGMSVSLVVRKHGVAPISCSAGAGFTLRGCLSAVGAGEEVVPTSEYRALQSWVRTLQGCLAKRPWTTESCGRQRAARGGAKRQP